MLVPKLWALAIAGFADAEGDRCQRDADVALFHRRFDRLAPLTHGK